MPWSQGRAIFEHKLGREDEEEWRSGNRATRKTFPDSKNQNQPDRHRNRTGARCFRMIPLSFFTGSSGKLTIVTMYGDSGRWRGNNNQGKIMGYSKYSSQATKGIVLS